ncbi:MAG: helix-turn-helix transcriptional regulator [Cytophagales bacterium]|nr:helix-turn-helix transcriptional regulator [Cytophagales bacterium]
MEKTPNGSHQGKADDAVSLTDQEIQIIRMICEEKTTEEIAKSLNISPRSTSRYREKLLIKTGSRSAIGILKFAVKHKIYHLSRDNSHFM